MSISFVKYHDTGLTEPDITIILGIPTYDALHQMQLELKTNTLSVHYNLGGSTRGNLILLMTDAKSAILSNEPYILPVRPGILLIPNNATRVSSYEHKCLYKDNIRVFHKVRRD